MEQKCGMSKNITQLTKKRNWAFVLYPESAPVDFINQLQQTGLQIAISPLHDKDINPDGSKKKPHWHVLLVYPGPQTYKSVTALTDRLCAPAPIPIDSIKGYYRYLTHKDNPEKAQYDEKDIRVLNGFSILDFVDLTRAEVNALKKELIKIIRENQILEYSTFVDFLEAAGTPEQYDIAVNHTFFFDKYLTSYRHKKESELRQQSSKVGLSKLVDEAE
jgi:hypothetical protein